MSGELDLSTKREGSCAVVSVGGELDPGTANELSDAALAAIQEIGPSIVLDLSDVTFMDSTGLKVLLAVHQRAQLAGGRLVLAATPRAVQRVVTITGLEETFEIRDNVEEAIAACAGDESD